MSNFWNGYGTMPEKIKTINQLMQDTLYASSNRAVREVLDYQFASEGKYLRAGLTILAGEAGDGGAKGLLETAAAFEMLHMATLVHDDIIDDSEMRRGAQSIQSRFGKDVAVYAGDYILARTFRFIQENSISHLDQISKGIEKICLGEMNQNENRYRMDITTKDYLRTISGKTATLFYLCLSAGARIGGVADREAGHLSNSGFQIGMAFQIMDDCRDYDGALEDLRKEAGSDVANGIYTLPLILALRSGRYPDLKEALAQGDAGRVIRIICASPEIEEARRIAKRYYEKAQQHLGRVKNKEVSEKIGSVYERLV